MKSIKFNPLSIYAIYILSAILNFWLILFNLGISAGFANSIPFVGLIGTLSLFIIASPMIFYKSRYALILGLINLLLILPFSISFLISLFKDWDFSWSLFLVAIPEILVFISVCITIKYLFTKRILVNSIFINLTTKIILSVLPFLLFMLYVIFYGKYWNFSNLFNSGKL